MDLEESHMRAAWTSSCTVSSMRGGKALQILVRAPREGRRRSSLSLLASTPSSVHTQFRASLGAGSRRTSRLCITKKPFYIQGARTWP